MCRAVWWGAAGVEAGVSRAGRSQCAVESERIVSSKSDGGWDRLKVVSQPTRGHVSCRAIEKVLRKKKEKERKEDERRVVSQ
jgi:hypothetical protein